MKVFCIKDIKIYKIWKCISKLSSCRGIKIFKKFILFFQLISNEEMEPEYFLISSKIFNLSKLTKDKTKVKNSKTKINSFNWKGFVLPRVAELLIHNKKSIMLSFVLVYIIHSLLETLVLKVWPSSSVFQIRNILSVISHGLVFRFVLKFT